MRLGVTPVPNRVSEQDLHQALHEISMRLPNESLEILSGTPLWSAIAHSAVDQNWWFGRTEQLVGRSLTPRIGPWNKVYKSLAKYGFGFDARHNYSNLLLVQVLLEIGADPAENVELIDDVARDGNATVMQLLLSDPRTIVNGYALDPILIAATRGHAALLKLLLADARLNPGQILSDVVEEHETECVRILLADSRVDPSYDRNTAVIIAAKYGYADIMELLLADERVQEMELDEEDDYGLDKAVQGSHVDVVRLILAQKQLQFIHWSLIEACKGSSFETVQLLFNDERLDPSANMNDCLRYARKRKDKRIEALLLTDPHVRELDERLARGERSWD